MNPTTKLLAKSSPLRLPLPSLYSARGADFVSLTKRLLSQQLQHLHSLLPPATATSTELEACVALIDHSDSNTPHFAQLIASLQPRHHQLIRTVLHAVSSTEEATHIYRATLGSSTLLNEFCARTSGKRGYIQQIDLAATVARTVAQCAKRLQLSPAVSIHGSVSSRVLCVEPLLKSILRVAIDHALLGDRLRITLAEGDEDFCVRISDEGGGTSYRQMQRRFQWPPSDESWNVAAAKTAAKYFGGDFDMLSMEGFGTDSFVYVTKQPHLSIDEEDCWERMECAWHGWFNEPSLSIY